MMRLMLLRRRGRFGVVGNEGLVVGVCPVGFWDLDLLVNFSAGVSGRFASSCPCLCVLCAVRDEIPLMLY